MDLSDIVITHFSQAAETNPSSAPFRLTDSSTLQNHSDGQEMLHLLQRITRSSPLHSIPCSSLLLLGLTLRKGPQGVFLSYPKSRELHSMPGWQKSHQALVSAHPDSCPADSHLCTHWLIQAYRLLCIEFSWSNEHHSVKQRRKLQFIYRGCTYTFTILSDVHSWSPALLHWSHHFLVTNTYIFVLQLRA